MNTPAPPPTGFYNAETFNLSTELIAVHKDCYTALNLTRQGGPRRRETLEGDAGTPLTIDQLLPWAYQKQELKAVA